MEGALEEFRIWANRTGNFIPFLENRAVSLSNGKIAVESLQCVPFILDKVPGAKQDYDWETPCPPIAQRISDYDAARVVASEAPYTAITEMPEEAKGQFIVNKYAIQEHARSLVNSLACMVGSQSLRALLVSCW